MTFQFYSHFIWKKCDLAATQLARILTWFLFTVNEDFFVILDKLWFFCLGLLFSSVTERWHYFPAHFGQPGFWTCLSYPWGMYAVRDLLFLYFVLTFRSLRQNFGISVIFYMCLSCSWISVHLLGTWSSVQLVSPFNLKEIILHCYN